MPRGMRRLVPALAISAAFALFGGSSALGQGADVSFGVQMRGGVNYFSLNHDASMYTPPAGYPMTSYGNPTSILSYEPLYSADIKFVLAGRHDTGWFELMAAFPIAGGGTFADRDYEAGQTLYSETFSDISLGGFGEASVRFSLPGNDNWQVNGAVIQPYIVAGAGLRSYAAKGLRCGAACPSGSLPGAITVIGQDMFSVTGGLGAKIEKPVSERGALDFRVEVAGGYLGVSDSHYFRIADLGPVPNITYSFGTMGLSAELGYTHAVSESAKLRAGVFADGQLGFGNVVFNSAGGGTGPAIPAWSHSISGGVVLGAAVAF